jgi:L-aminopeptidase/D-esterase-like protein
VRPTADNGYAACEAAAGGAVAQGNVGAGAGATVGKMLGFEQASKGGLGTASIQIEGGVIVAALVAVNAVGDVVDPRTGQVIAGARKPGGGFAFDGAPGGGTGPGPDMTLQNTTIAIVATNAKMSKAGATKVAQMAHDGLARVIRPAHTPMDGDTVFALSLGRLTADTGRVGAVAAEVLAEAVLAGVMAAEALKGIPSARDLQKPARKTAGS